MTMPIFDHTHPKIIERTFSFREFAPACKKSALREKCWNTKFFWSVFSRIRTECGEILCPNAGKDRPEKTPYLDTFHAVQFIPFIHSWDKILEPHDYTGQVHV